MTYVPTAPAAIAHADTALTRATEGLHNDVASAHVEVASWHFDNLEVQLEPTHRTFWAFMRPTGKPSFTRELLRDIAEMQHGVRRLFADRANEGEKPVNYYVLGSRTPGIFNLGGDLSHFAERIRAQDRSSLRRYGQVCVDAVYNNSVAFDTPVVTIALVQGDALGGGFECALAFDVIVAERSAKFGLPEILFNLFPGMGAYSFLSRRIGPVKAEQMIMSGRLYTAEELHEMGIVDVLAEDGMGEEAVHDYIAKNSRKHNAHRAVFQARRRVNPVTLDELRDVVDIWVEAALNLTEMDIKKMLRLTAAQERRMASNTPASAPFAMAAE